MAQRIKLDELLKTQQEATALEMLRAIQQELSAKSEDVIPVGWKTANTWADESGLARKTVSEILRLGSLSGSVEKQSFRVNCGGGGVRPVIHYRKIEAAKAKKR